MLPASASLTANRREELLAAQAIPATEQTEILTVMLTLDEK